MDFSIYDILWSIVNFLVLVAILNKIFYKPVMGALENRQNEITNNLHQAEQDKIEARKIKNEYSTHLRDVKKEAQGIIAQANKLGEENKDEIIAEAREEAEAMLNKSKRVIEEEKQKALLEIHDEIAVLAVMTAEKIIEKNINAKDQEKLVQDFIEEVGEVH